VSARAIRAALPAVVKNLNRLMVKPHQKNNSRGMTCLPRLPAFRRATTENQDGKGRKAE
jgi:hypothetical protein